MGTREKKDKVVLEGLPAPTTQVRKGAVGQMGSDLEDAARDLLLLTARGEGIPASAITRLVDAILGVPLVGLALEARAPGPHQLMHALRLAAAVCEAFAARRDLKASGEGA